MFGLDSSVLGIWLMFLRISMCIQHFFSFYDTDILLVLLHRAALSHRTHINANTYSHYRLIIYKISDQLIMLEIAQIRGLEKCPVPSTIVHEDFLVFLNVPGCYDPRASLCGRFYEHNIMSRRSSTVIDESCKGMGTIQRVHIHVFA